MRTIKGQIYKAVAVVSGFSVATRAAAFVFKIYLSRAFGAEAVGLYQICISVFYLLVAFAASGIPLVLSRKIAAQSVPDNRLSSSYITAGLIISVGAAAFIMLIFYLFGDFFGGIFSDERCRPLFELMLPALISTCAYSVLRGWFLGHRDYAVFSFTELLEEFFRVLFSIFLAGGIFYSLKGIKGIALAFTVSDFASAAALLVLYFKKKGRLVAPRGFKELTAASTPLSLMRIFGSLVGSAVAIIIPARLISAGMTVTEATAAYGRVSGMALPLIMAPMAVTGALAVVLIPEIVSAYNNKRGTLPAKIEGAINFSFFISAFFCVIYLPLGRELTDFVFKDALAGEFVRNCALLIFPLGLSQVTNSILNSLGLEKVTFKNFIIGTVLLMLSLTFATKYIGIYSISLGYGLCYTIITVLNLIKLKKAVEFEIEGKRLIKFAVFALPSSLLANLTNKLLVLIFPSMLAMALSAAIGAAAFTALCALFKAIDADGLWLKQKLRHYRLRRIKIL